MNIVYITGSSRGIGKALVDKFLEMDCYFVYGLSRSNSIIHNNFNHIKIDLSDINQVHNFSFENHNKANQIILINNSGIIGPVSPVGRQNSSSIVDTFNINTIAPAILTNKFIAAFENSESQKTIINTSSGAGRHTVKSWSTYCGSKAALDMISMVIADEQKDNSNPIRIYSVAPGVVDSTMQDEIRMQNKEDFPDLEKFIDYKRNNLLSSPEEVAKKYLYILNNPEIFTEPIINVREIK